MEKQSYRCALCGEGLNPRGAVYALRARLKEEWEYPDSVEGATLVDIPVRGRTLQCIVAADGSPAKMEGWDLIFMVCSEECGAELQKLLDDAGDIFDEVM